MVKLSGSKKVIKLLEDFFDTVDQGVLVFKNGVNNYLYGNKENFHDNLMNLVRLENDADLIKKEVENLLYTRSLVPQFRGDLLKLLDDMDTILDTVKENLSQFDVEMPSIPVELNQDFNKLTELSVSAVESLLPTVRAFFRTPDTVRDQLHRVYFFEKETDKMALAIKKKVFHEMTNLNLSEKFHLRYFTLHIENVSDVAQKVADLLSIMAIKRTI
ncbi:MAG: DUF47 family protein [Tenuifilaceae bacterium]|jgi:hypothetical protein|nr:DUF47 family protein [Bacteroidales bacterium]MDI9516483.1 DUF47 family protein [Bacteroidota bacterium]NLH56851.1 DUF47 family protein [Rikenellaceae bacterium]OQC62412.1 MAG: hypothetical protein BWX49_01718 [Bacteroidetes bacterium ADurb.Bin008]HNV81838.1 DUF47 family protein [Tenuifilaceae bacterium]